MGKSTAGDLVWHLGPPLDALCFEAAGILALLRLPHMDNGCLARDKKNNAFSSHLSASSSFRVRVDRGEKHAQARHILCIGKWLNIHLE